MCCVNRSCHVGVLDNIVARQVFSAVTFNNFEILGLLCGALGVLLRFVCM